MKNKIITLKELLAPPTAADRAARAANPDSPWMKHFREVVKQAQEREAAKWRKK